MGAYIWSQTIVAMIDAGLVAGALVLMGLSDSLGLVPLVFFAAFIPYIGYLIWGLFLCSWRWAAATRISEPSPYSWLSS